MKKAIVLVTILTILCLTGCAKETPTSSEPKATPTDASTSYENPSESVSPEPDKISTEAQWPKEFEAWGVPIISNAILTSSDNRSIDENGLYTQGINAIVNLDALSKDELDSYLKALEDSGFIQNEAESLDGVMYSFNKSLSDGEISIIIAYSEESTTITVHNSSSSNTEKATTADGSTWPEALKEIPEFSKGKLKETIDMGGGMYTLTYLGVTSTDLDDYSQTLIASGYMETDTETPGYAKIAVDRSYSVGFVLEGDTLQIIAMVQSY